MIFLTKAAVLAIHDRAIAEFGGLPGIRDEAALESALMAVENRYAYADADLAGCAATYAYHLSKAHAFFDGNKRVSGAATEVFVIINGARLAITNGQFVDFFLSIAAGESHATPPRYSYGCGLRSRNTQLDKPKPQPE